MKLNFILIVLALLAACQTPVHPNDASSKKADTIPETAIADIKKEQLPQKDAADLFIVWQHVMSAIEKEDLIRLRKLSFDSVYCQACKPFPTGTDVDNIPVQYMSLSDFTNCYNNSFLFPKLLHYMPKSGSLSTEYVISNTKKPHNFTSLPGDSILLYRLRFSDNDKNSLVYAFVKFNYKFRFFGLYM